MFANKSAQDRVAGPSFPSLTKRDLLRQVWADAYGKEVQSAATYSYLWLADQVGHVCVGIIVDFAATVVIGLAMTYVLGAASAAKYGMWLGLVLTVIGVSIWEWSAYHSSVKQATGLFPLDTKLLAANAFVATAYMALGGVLGFAFHLPLYPAVFLSAAVVAAAIVLAPSWVRQKIIWQKASIPYLFRLADVMPTIEKVDAIQLQNLIENGAPPSTKPCQIIIGGPIDSGRTPAAAGIATEFSFRGNKVRYLSLDCLLEFAAHASSGKYPDDQGPTTISYWRWSEAQVVVIDGVGPVISATEPDRSASYTRFKRMLENDLSNIADVLGRCHTVWVLGDLSPPPPSDKFGELLADFAKAVAYYCNSGQDPFVIELSPLPERLKIKGPLLPTTRAAAHVTAVRGVRRISMTPK